MTTPTISELEDHLRRDGIEKPLVGAVIFAPPTAEVPRVLLLKRSQDEYLGGLVELPSGAVEPGEPLLVALAREVEEETGLRYQDEPQYLGAFDYLSGSGRRARQLNFALRAEDISIVLNPSEHCAHYWVSEAELAGFANQISPETHAIVWRALRDPDQRLGR